MHKTFGCDLRAFLSIAACFRSITFLISCIFARSLEISYLVSNNSSLYNGIILDHMALLMLLLLDDNLFFLRWKNVSRWCFLCRFSVYCFIASVSLFWIRFKRHFLEMNLAPHFPHHLCVSGAVDPCAAQYAMCIYSIWSHRRRSYF